MSSQRDDRAKVRNYKRIVLEVIAYAEKNIDMDGGSLFDHTCIAAFSWWLDEDELGEMRHCPVPQKLFDEAANYLFKNGLNTCTGGPKECDACCTNIFEGSFDLYHGHVWV